MKIEENKSLATLTTFGIGGPGRWFVEARGEADIVEATAWASERAIELFVLGGGSNLLVADAGFDGLVLRVGLLGVERSGSSQSPLYAVAAGEEWDGFVGLAVGEDSGGIECLAGIPGTVGGTPVQNVGAYGQEVSTTIERVRAFDRVRRDFIEFTAAECEFSYRRSRFNTTERGRYIVTRVDYRLVGGAAPSLRYADLKRSFAADSDPTLAEVAAVVRRIRERKGMLLVKGDPDCCSAGSFFKNPVITEEEYKALAAGKPVPPPYFPVGVDGQGHVKLPAAWLIEQAGFSKGFVLGEAGISSRHTLALINRGGAKAAEILALRDAIVVAVKARFGICLEMEPVMLGF